MECTKEMFIDWYQESFFFMSSTWKC